MSRVRIPFPSAGGTYEHRDGQLHRVAPAAADSPPAVVVAPPPPSIADIERAIARLDPKQRSHWTRSGKPRVEAIERVLDAAITESQRDAAWASLQPLNANED